MKTRKNWKGGDMTISVEKTNPEKIQDRAFDLYDHYQSGGYVMFHQQRKIYEHLAREAKGKNVVEFGCGNGVGSALLERTAADFVGTDGSFDNVSFATQLYPWVNFHHWDIQHLTKQNFYHQILFPCDFAIAVDVLEHVKHPKAAIETMLHLAREEVWISTPQGDGKTYPPENPFHVREYTVLEMLKFLDGYKVTVHHWKTWEILTSINPDVTPLVYQVKVSA